MNLMQEITISFPVWQLVFIVYFLSNIFILAIYLDDIFDQPLIYRIVSILVVLCVGGLHWAFKIWEFGKRMVLKTYANRWLQLWFTKEFNNMSEAWVDRTHKRYIANRRKLTWFQKAFYFAMRRRNITLFKKIEDEYCTEHNMYSILYYKPLFSIK